MANRTNIMIIDDFYSNKILPELIHIQIYAPTMDAHKLIEELKSQKKCEPFILVLALDELIYIKKA